MIHVSILQDNYTARAAPPEETAAVEEFRRMGERYKEAILAPQIDLAVQAASQGTGLIVFREDCNGAGLFCHRADRPGLFEALAETIPGPTSEKLSAVARRGGCYVSGCYFEKLDGKIYNTAVLINPSGQVIAKYHKTHLPPLERFLVTPGNDLPVFDTEIGRVAMLICYDMMTPEVVRCLALNGADVLIWPSLGYGWWEDAGHFTIRSRAHDNQVYILGALPANSCIVDPYGDFVAAGGITPLGLICGQIDPGKEPVQPANHTNAFLTSTPSLRERHLFERRPELYHPITAETPPLTTRYPQTHMHDLEDDPLGALARYRNEQESLVWHTRTDQPTRP
jgi:predicted amidohydrolase